MEPIAAVGEYCFERLRDVLKKFQVKKPLLVCGSPYTHLHIGERLQELGISYTRFDDFFSNPTYEEVCHGVSLFRDKRCDAILAIGGGSCIDTAKCIKLFCKMDPAKNYLKQEYIDNRIPLIVMPTTAGTGSEATRYAVIYYAGEKQSVTHGSIMPDCAILCPKFLETLPLYQKKSALLDALCQGIESWWSIHSTEESREHSRCAVDLIVHYEEDYLAGWNEEAAGQIMFAANEAGKAINITQTTAPHAMSYKLTSLYRIAHGHATALCLPEVWEYMVQNINQCVDIRGEAYLRRAFSDIAQALGCQSVPNAIEKFRERIEKWEMQYPTAEDYGKELKQLCDSVNPVRLKNNPVPLDSNAICRLYERIVKNEC